MTGKQEEAMRARTRERMIYVFRTRGVEERGLQEQNRMSRTVQNARSVPAENDAAPGRPIQSSRGRLSRQTLRISLKDGTSAGDA